MKRSSGTYTPDVYQDGRINIGLTTGDSYWKGLIDNANLAQTSPTEKDSYNHPKYDPAVTPVDADHSGEVNLWLQNGAQWIYENASRKDGLDYKHMPEYSQSSYGSYDGMSHLTSEPEASVRPLTALSKSPEIPFRESRTPEMVFLSSLALTENVES